MSYVLFNQCALDLMRIFERREIIRRPSGRISPWFKPQMVRSVLVSECESMIPQTSSFSRAQEKSEFCRCCIVSIHGWGGWNSTAEHWRRYGGSLQIIRCPCLNRHLQRARLAHQASSRRIFWPLRCLRGGRTAREKRETRDSSGQAN